MWRYIGEFVSLIFIFLLVRSVLASVWQSVRGGVMDAMSPQQPTRPGAPSSGSPAASTARSPNEMHTSGELRKDPVCGTFVLTSTALTAQGENGTSYFCSKECRDRFLSQKRWPKSTAARS